MTEYIITDEQAKEAAEHLPLFSVLSWLHKWAVAEESSGYKTITEHVGVNLPEIVRCRDCKNYTAGDDAYATDDWCAWWGGVCPSGDGFCAWSERRQA